MALPTYSSREVNVAFAGLPLDGLAPDSFITFSRNESITDEEVGADGMLSISFHPNRTGTCSLSFQQQSLSNNILAGIVNRQEQQGGLVIGDITITNFSGSTLAVLSNCHVKTLPEVDFGNVATGKTRTWEFFCERMTFSDSPSGSALSGTDAQFVASILGSVSISF